MPMQAHPAGPDIALPHTDARPGFIRTTLTLMVLAAVLIGSWALVIGAIVLVVRLFT